MNKKKLLTLAMVLSMVAILVVGGTIAYFTDTEDRINTFTFGNVSIIQRESQRNLDEYAAEFEDEAPAFTDNTTLEQFEDAKNVFPAVLKKLKPTEAMTVEGFDFTIRKLEGNYVDKIVNVYNDGTEKAYIRTLIAVPSINGFDDSSDATENPIHWNYLDAKDFANGIGWDWNGSNDAEAREQKEYVQALNIAGVEYDIYVATYNTAVEAEAWTSPSMLGFYLHDTVGFKDGKYFFVDSEGEHDLSKWMKPAEDGKVTMNIMVISQASQTEGFADAWEALDTAFGEVNKENATKWFNEILPTM